jgi:hypothetical protein
VIVGNREAKRNSGQSAVECILRFSAEAEPRHAQN